MLQVQHTKINRERLISKEQLHILYHSDERNLIRDHKKYAGNKLTQICICKYSAKAHIDVRVVDITLANYIIQKCGKHELGIDNWMKQIKDVRNEIFHLSDFQEIKDVKFSRKWTTLEGSLLGIANVIGTECVVETKKNIMQAKQLTLIGDYMLKYEIICRDYWKNKCTEFERAQNQVIEEKQLLYTITCLSSLVDRWKRLSANNEKNTLTGTPDMNIRIKAISIDDLNMYAEIAKQVLGNVHELRSEINKLMSTMLSDAEIDTMEHADVGVNFEVLDRSDNSYAVKISETKEEIGELPDNSVNQQCSTTESDGVSTADNVIKKEEEMGKPPDISITQKCSTNEPDGLLNAETTIETKEEMSTPTDSSNNQDFSTTEPDGNVSMFIFNVHGLYYFETRS
ncbi:unnamed protein product [Mytilus edulis]|uniref:Uncharacterized protein n=1 Tax=Mytilus edulis TaxID=6550 RepID=A0A8S3V595_MYTED|nr:unnamed protein product [Mytilus edulis]